MSQITAQLMQLPHGKDLPLPSYETAEAAGMDLRAAVPEDAPLTLNPGTRACAHRLCNGDTARF